MSRNQTVLVLASAGVLVVSIPGAQSAPPCEQWNTREFFETATVEDVTACLAAGADVDARDERDVTPLHWAAVANQDPAVIEALLAAGADLEARAPALIDITPLHAAAEGNENPAVLEVLLAAGANPMARSTDGRTAMHFAATNNESPKVIEVLSAAGADPNELDQDNNAPLDLALRQANPEMLEVLLAVGADPNAPDPNGNTPLHRAALRERPAAIEVLLAGGADPDARDQEGNTPLHRAANSNENTNVLELLLRAGADVNSPADDGRTPLHRAAEGNAVNAAVAEALLAAGADLHARDDEGNTPLHRAALGPSGVAIEVQLGAGADASARNAAGQVPWDLARRNHRLKGSYAYWWLNDLRFDRPAPDVRPASAPGRTSVAPPPDRTELDDRISEARETPRPTAPLVYVSEILLSLEDSPEAEIAAEFSIVGPVFRSNESDTLTIRAIPRAFDLEYLISQYSDYPASFMYFGTDRREFYRNGSLFDTGGPLGGASNDIDGICLEPETEQLRLLTATWSGGAPDPENHWVLSFSDDGLDYARLSAIDSPVAAPADCADGETLWQWGSRFRPCICTGRASNVDHYATQRVLFSDIDAVTAVSDGPPGIDDDVLTVLVERIHALRSSAAWDSAAEIGVEQFQSDEFEVLEIHYRHSLLADDPFQYIFARAVDREVWRLLYEKRYSPKSWNFATIHGFTDGDTLELDVCVEDCTWWSRHQRVQWHLGKRLASAMGGN